MSTELLHMRGLTIRLDRDCLEIVTPGDGTARVPIRMLPYLAVVAEEVARGARDEIDFDGCASPRYPCALCRVVEAKCPNKKSPCRHHCHTSGCMR